MRRLILAIVAAICFPGLAHSATPDRVILVAQDVPNGAEPAAFRVVAQVVNEPTCWQLAKLANAGAPAQVFYCASPDSFKSVVPPPQPKGKYVRA